MTAWRSTFTGFSQREVVGLVPGMNYRALDYAARTRIVEPSIAAARGSGSQRLWSHRDVVALRALALLRDAAHYDGHGSRLWIRTALDLIYAAPTETLSDGYLVVRAHQPAIVDAAGLSEIALTSREAWMVLPLAQLLDGLLEVAS